MGEKNTSEKQLRLGTTRHDQDGIGKFISPIPTQREVEIAWVGTDELRYLPHFASCCLFGPPGPLRFVAQNPVKSNSLCLTHPFVFFLCVRCDYTLSSTVYKGTPCQQRKSHQLWQFLFRRFMTPSLTLVRPGH